MPYRLVALATLVAACASDRDPVDRGGVHPVGFADPDSAEFHGAALDAAGDPIAECQSCHGQDFGGGAVGVDCGSSGCHDAERGPVTSCTTCHGSEGSPLPAEAPHPAHAGVACTDCHVVPSTPFEGQHLDGEPTVVFSGLATAAGFEPSWDAATEQCSGAYCHNGATVSWGDEELGCDACHQAPPDDHARFARVADGPDSCARCHPSEGHIDGALEVGDPACDSCHGEGTLGAPAPDLAGDVAASDPQVGAHARHLDITLPDRIGKAVACQSCHPVPDSVFSPGHIDEAGPADVQPVLGGTYDPETGRCTVWCHFDRQPGPSWTDDSGAARACDACHAFPPAVTRSGATHPASAPSLSACRECHVFATSTHVDGTVNLK